MDMPDLEEVFDLRVAQDAVQERILDDAQRDVIHDLSAFDDIASLNRKARARIAGLMKIVMACNRLEQEMFLVSTSAKASDE